MSLYCLSSCNTSAYTKFSIKGIGVNWNHGYLYLVLEYNGVRMTFPLDLIFKFHGMVYFFTHSGVMKHIANYKKDVGGQENEN